MGADVAAVTQAFKNDIIFLGILFVVMMSFIWIPFKDYLKPKD